MNQKEVRDLLESATKKWGERAQLEMMQEEATELALAARKFIRVQNDENLQALGSEIADVEIMIKQMRQMFISLDYFISDEKKRKLLRLKERIKNNSFE